MSGYTTSVSLIDAYSPSTESSTSNYSSNNVINRLIHRKYDEPYLIKDDNQKIREMLLNIPAEEFFQIYTEREPYEEIPLLTADGVVIPKIGLMKSLSDNSYLNIVPTIAGSNRDEVKLQE